MLAGEVVSIPLQPLAQRLLLNGLPGVGPVTVRRLLEAFGNDLSLALAAPRERLQRIKGITKVAADSIACRDFDWAKELSPKAPRCLTPARSRSSGRDIARLMELR
ncbi:MAG: hypothetical protein EBU04_01565 [Verrucomicrobia bacterium]|nr:hypothetical protein [Verrucomicrobiota bacterium]